MAKTTPYEKGARWEMQVKKQLEAEGYEVIRSAGSHCLFDLAAVKSTHIRLIQCKYNVLPSSEEIEAIRLFDVPQYCSKEIWYRKKWSRKGFVQEVK